MHLLVEYKHAEPMIYQSYDNSKHFEIFHSISTQFYKRGILYAHGVIKQYSAIMHICLKTYTVINFYTE